MAKSRGGSNKRAVDPDTIKMPASAGEIHKLRRYHSELGDVLAKLDAGRGPFDRVSFHVRRHLPLYAIAALFALVVVLVPTRNERHDVSTSASEISDTSGATVEGSSAASGAAKDGETNVIGTSVTGSGSGATTTFHGQKVAGVKAGTGTTIGGFACKPGVRQVPWSAYAAPCVDHFVGNNGGETYRGVTAKEIKLVIRKTADSGGPSAQTVDTANKQAGRASRTEYLEFVKKYWIPYFNKMFELYGRKVVLAEYGSTQSNGVEEAQSRGKDGACADATAIANSVKAFGDLAFATGFGESQPFSECAKEKGGIFVPLGAAYYPEGTVPDPKGINLTGLSYQSWRPYVYHIVMECEQIAVDVAEYTGKRLNGRLAKWARDPTYQKEKRIFGTYVPDNDGYQHCVNIYENDFKMKYGGKITWRHNYPLDVSRFPDQAAQAVLEFQSHGVTTLINACDTISTQLMTEAADKQGWGPEWFIIGVANQDTNGSARSFNDNAVTGHLFGMSQLGPDYKTLGKDSEPSRAFKTANPGVTPPQGSLQAYWPLMHIFNLLQSAGPILTPQNIELGAQKMPPGGGNTGAVGTWQLNGDHTEIDDSREIFWEQSLQAVDGKGSYVETHGGRRYGSGEWSREEPPVYPELKK